MLDVSGDSVHMINNVAKVLLSNVDSNLQSFCSDMFYDIEESPKVKQIFHELQTLMNIAIPKHLIRPISSRFLQMQDVCTRIVELLDPLTLYYCSFLTEAEKTKYRDVTNHILLNNKLSEEAQSAIILMQMSQDQQQKSTTSSDRKGRIMNSLFLNRRQTIVMLNLFRGLLSMFQHYVKAFQTEKPMIHLLHSQIVEVVQQLLGMFIKPEHIPDSVSKLKNLDVTNRNIQKADKDLGVGKHAFADLNKARIDKTCHHWVTKVYSNLRAGYVMAGQKILKMPIENKTLRLMSVLEPEFVGHSQTEVSFMKIEEKMPNAFPSEELGQLAVDAARYNSDKEVKLLASQYSEADPIDTGFWAKVFLLQSFNQIRYPALKKLVTSVLTIFSGPLIESTFNIMDDIIEKDRTKMTLLNYEAVAIVKTVLRKKKMKSTDMEVPASMKKSCINAYATYKKHVKEMKEEKQTKHEEKLQSSVQLLKVEKAKRLAKLMRLKNKVLGKKRKSTCSDGNERSGNSGGARKWKRIRTQ